MSFTLGFSRDEYFGTDHSSCSFFCAEKSPIQRFETKILEDK